MPKTTNLMMDMLEGAGYIRQAPLLDHVVPWSGSTLWRKVKTGDFPKPIKLSDHITAWKKSDVRKWMEERDAQLA